MTMEHKWQCDINTLGVESQCVHFDLQDCYNCAGPAAAPVLW